VAGYPRPEDGVHPRRKIHPRVSSRSLGQPLEALGNDVLR